MRAMCRRLARLEAKYVPTVNHESYGVALLIWESRQRRRVAECLPAEPRPEQVSSLPGMHLSLAQAIRAARELLQRAAGVSKYEHEEQP